jgi:hypothetical protein
MGLHSCNLNACEKLESGYVVRRSHVNSSITQFSTLNSEEHHY